MGRDDWYRRTTWTKRDQQEFFERNARSRGNHNKAQYLRIQAETLRATNEPKLVSAALSLLEKYFDEHPDASDLAMAFQSAGQCCASLGRTDDAAEYYLKALARQQEKPGIETNAHLWLGQLAVENKRFDLYGQVEHAIDEARGPVFPVEVYLVNGIRALIVADRDQNYDLASRLARAAIEAAQVQDSGLGWGRGLIGTVSDTDTVIHRRLLEISGRHH